MRKRRLSRFEHFDRCRIAAPGRCYSKRWSPLAQPERSSSRAFRRSRRAHRVPDFVLALEVKAASMVSLLWSCALQLQPRATVALDSTLIDSGAHLRSPGSRSVEHTRGHAPDPSSLPVHRLPVPARRASRRSRLPRLHEEPRGRALAPAVPHLRAHVLQPSRHGVLPAAAPAAVG